MLSENIFWDKRVILLNIATVFIAIFLGSICFVGFALIWSMFFSEIETVVLLSYIPTLIFLVVFFYLAEYRLHSHFRNKYIKPLIAKAERQVNTVVAIKQGLIEMMEKSKQQLEGIKKLQQDLPDLRKVAIEADDQEILAEIDSMQESLSEQMQDIESFLEQIVAAQQINNELLRGYSQTTIYNARLQYHMTLIRQQQSATDAQRILQRAIERRMTQLRSAHE